MDDEFALFAAEIGEIEKKIEEPVTEEHAPEPPPPKPSKPAVTIAASARAATIAKAPEHVPVGPPTRPPPPPPAPAVTMPPRIPLGHPSRCPITRWRTTCPRSPPGARIPHTACRLAGIPQGLRTRTPPAGAHLPPVPGGGGAAPVKRVGKPVYRAAGGDRWVDPSLADWPEGDHRIFCGDLGLECTDETLARAFSHYPSFAMARVVKDKKSGKNRGYGFVSLMDPLDHADAIKKMNGKYIGNRPCKLKNADWESRNDAKGDSRNTRPSARFSRSASTSPPAWTRTRGGEETCARWLRRGRVGRRREARASSISGDEPSGCSRSRCVKVVAFQKLI